MYFFLKIERLPKDIQKAEKNKMILKWVDEENNEGRIQQMLTRGERCSNIMTNLKEEEINSDNNRSN